MNKKEFASYHGEKCARCNGTWRYSVSHDCIVCSRERKAIQYKARTETFLGDPCRACGCTTRYVRSGNCIKCQKTHNLKSRQAVKGTRPPVGRPEDNRIMAAWLKKAWIWR